MENPIKIHDLGVPLFLETPIYIYILPQTNIAPEQMASQKERIVFQASFFRGESVSFRERILYILAKL